MIEGCADPIIFEERGPNRIGPGVTGVRYITSNPLTPKQRREYFQHREWSYIETGDGRIEPARNRAERRAAGYRAPVKGKQ